MTVISIDPEAILLTVRPTISKKRYVEQRGREITAAVKPTRYTQGRILAFKPPLRIIFQNTNYKPILR